MILCAKWVRSSPFLQFKNSKRGRKNCPQLNLRTYVKFGHRPQMSCTCSDSLLDFKNKYSEVENLYKFNISKNSPEWPFLAFSKNNFNFTVFLLSAKKTICLFRAVFFIHRMCDQKSHRGEFLDILLYRKPYNIYEI